MEQSFTRKLESLRHQQPTREYDELLFTTEQLVTLTAEQSHTFSDTPRASQMIWVGDDTGSQFHRDTLGVNVLQDGLIIGVHTQDPSEPHRNIVIGVNYANYGEWSATRPSIYEHKLDAEHLTLFSHHFHAMIARLGLSRIIEARASEKQAA